MASSVASVKTTYAGTPAEAAMPARHVRSASYTAAVVAAAGSPRTDRPCAGRR